MTSQVIKLWRILFIIIYLIISILIVNFRFDHMFYIDPSIVETNFDRYLWCVSSAFFGFSFLSFQLRNHPNSPFPSYLTYYPFLLFVISTFVFSICHIFENTGGFVFYYLSFFISFVLGYLVDDFWEIIRSLIVNKLKKIAE